MVSAGLKAHNLPQQLVFSFLPLAGMRMNFCLDNNGNLMPI